MTAFRRKCESVYTVYNGEEYIFANSFFVTEKL